MLKIMDLPNLFCTITHPSSMRILLHSIMGLENTKKIARKKIEVAKTKTFPETCHFKISHTLITHDMDMAIMTVSICRGCGE